MARVSPPLWRTKKSKSCSAEKFEPIVLRTIGMEGGFASWPPSGKETQSQTIEQYPKSSRQNSNCCLGLFVPKCGLDEAVVPQNNAHSTVFRMPAFVRYNLYLLWPALQSNHVNLSGPTKISANEKNDSPHFVRRSKQGIATEVAEQFNLPYYHHSS